MFYHHQKTLNRYTLLYYFSAGGIPAKIGSCDSQIKILTKSTRARMLK